MAKQSTQNKVQNPATTVSKVASNNMTINEAVASETDELKELLNTLNQKLDEMETNEETEIEISEVKVEKVRRQMRWNEIVKTVAAVNGKVIRMSRRRVPDRGGSEVDPPEERDISPHRMHDRIPNDEYEKVYVKQAA